MNIKLRQRHSVSFLSQQFLVLLLSALIVSVAVAFGRVKGTSINRPETIGRLRQGIPSRGGANAAVRQEKVREAYGRLPMTFEVNKGQADAEVRFIARRGGLALFLTSSNAVFVFNKPNQESKDALPVDSLRRRPEQIQSDVLRLSLVGANTSAEATGLEKLPGKVNYFRGNDRASWHTDIPTFAKVRYRNVYPGVDQVFYGNQGQAEFDFVVAPGADPKAIQLALEGSNGLTLNENGDIKLAGTNLVMTRPEIYQEIEGVKRPVSGSYRLDKSNQVGFQIGSYDSSMPLIIDPGLVYSTYLGGTQGDVGVSIAVDTLGNAYVASVAISYDFPTVNPVPNASVPYAAWTTVVSKLNAAGNSLVYSTYIGDSGDMCYAIAVDALGSAYVAGGTGGGNFPLVSAFQSTPAGFGDAFVLKLSPAGNGIVFSTFLGGNGSDTAYGIAVDAAKTAYVTGETESTNFPGAPGHYQPTNHGGKDVFVTRLSPTGAALIYSTYLGGNDQDIATDIGIDVTRNAYITGYTFSTNFPTSNAHQGASAGNGDVFVSKLNTTGNALVYSTYLGGQQDDRAFGIGVDNAGNAYVTGATWSSDFPVISPLQTLKGGGDVFLSQFSPGGTLGFSSYFGGSTNWEFGRDAAVGTAGTVYITGQTDSIDFPTLNPAQPANAGPGGDSDTFISKFSIPPAPSVPPCVDPPNTTMVAWYPFDEASGFTATNLASGNTGNLINNPAHWHVGKVGRAILFDGLDDYVESPSTIVTNIGPAGLPQTCSGSYSTCRGDFSIDAWIQLFPNGSMSATPLVDKRMASGSTFRGYSLFVFQNNKFGLQLADGGAGSGYTNYLSPVIPGLINNWHHIAVTVSRRSSLGIKWYDNGALVGTSNPTSPAATARYGSLANNSPLRIGTNSFLTAWFKGAIDELEIFNRELTPTEVQGIYKAGAGGKCK